MSELSEIEQQELELLTKASIFLREKLLSHGRNGPLVKLLNREIDIFSDELGDRFKANEARKQAARASAVNRKTATKSVAQP